MARYAIKTPPHHATWAQFLDVWRAADEIDVFESAWSWDHFYPLAEPYDGPNLEGWTMLAALAQATSRLRLGAMVNGMHHRHPAVTANMAATIDHISGGRFELGMGAGWNVMESDAYGIPLGSLQERSDRFEEGIEVIVSLLTNTVTDFSGRWFQIENAWCEPKPVQDHLPIVVGGKGRRRTLRTAARFADQWDMTFPDGPPTGSNSTACCASTVRPSGATSRRSPDRCTSGSVRTTTSANSPTAPPGSSTPGSTSSCGRCAARSTHRGWSRWRTRSRDPLTRPTSNHGSTASATVVRW